MRRFRFSRYVVPLFSIGAALVVLITFAVSHFQNQANTTELLRGETTIWANGMSRSLVDAKLALYSLANEIEGQPIDVIHNAFQTLMFEYPLFRGASLVSDGKTIYTSYRIPEIDRQRTKVKIPNPGEISIEPSSSFDSRDASLVLTLRMDAETLIRVLIARQSLIDPLRFMRAEAIQGIFFLKGDGTLLLDSGIGYVPPFHSVPPLGLSKTADGMIYCSKVDGFDVFAVSYIPGNKIMQSWVDRLPLYGLLAMIVAVVFILYGWRLRTRLGGLRMELEEAIDLGQIEAFLQPVIDLKTGRCRGAEALMRWRHPRRGLIPPTLFIPEAERSGLITPMTFAMIEKIAKELADVFDQFKDFRININLSSISLNEPEFCTRCLELLQGCIDMNQVCFEITESAYIGPAAVERLHEFHRRGIKLAVDDFGTGYSNLRYLMDYPFDSLKIDKAFVDGINPDGQSSGLVDHVIEIGKSCKLSLVGEGVEKRFQAEYLFRAGVEFGQGYYFSRPMAGNEFVAWIMEHERTINKGNNPVSTG